MQLSPLSTGSPTPAWKQRFAWFPANSAGRACGNSSGSTPSTVSAASVQRYPNTSTSPQPPSPSHSPDSNTSTSFWSTHFHSPQVTPTCSLWSTGRRAGRRLFLSPVPPPPTAQRHSSQAGFNGSAFPLSSLQTEGRSSRPACGLPCAASSPSATGRRPPTTPSPTGW